VGISIGDSLAAMFGVIGASDGPARARALGRGQVVDVALYEAVFALMESMLPEYATTAACASGPGPRSPGSSHPTRIRAATAATW
jgi:formyl-CoA transferase